MMNSLLAYLNAWLQTATKCNVWAEHAAMGNWLVFRCRCGDNLHQKIETFGASSVPFEVQEWVKKHVHDKKADADRRELEALIKEAREKYDVETLKTMLTDPRPRPAEPVEMPTGRKFRRNNENPTV